EEGIARNEIAIRSDPLNPGIFFRYSGLALGHYLKGDYERAVEWARRSIHRNRNWYLGHIFLMAAFAGLDRIDEAQCARGEYALLFPKATISELKRLPFKSGVGFARLTAELRKAGLSE